MCGYCCCSVEWDLTCKDTCKEEEDVGLLNHKHLQVISLKHFFATKTCS